MAQSRQAASRSTGISGRPSDCSRTRYARDTCRLGCRTRHWTPATVEEAGVLPMGSRPWSVYESDLAVICDLVGDVGELVHYLGRRLAIEDLKVDGRPTDGLELPLAAFRAGKLLSLIHISEPTRPY